MGPFHHRGLLRLGGGDQVAVLVELVHGLALGCVTLALPGRRAGAAHEAGAAKHAAGLDTHALRGDVSLDLALRENLEMATAANVADDLSGDDHVRADDITAHD